MRESIWSGTAKDAVVAFGQRLIGAHVTPAWISGRAWSVAALVGHGMMCRAVSSTAVWSCDETYGIAILSFADGGDAEGRVPPRPCIQIDGLAVLAKHREMKAAWDSAIDNNDVSCSRCGAVHRGVTKLTGITCHCGALILAARDHSSKSRAAQKIEFKISGKTEVVVPVGGMVVPFTHPETGAAIHLYYRDKKSTLPKPKSLVDETWDTVVAREKALNDAMEKAALTRPPKLESTVEQLKAYGLTDDGVFHRKPTRLRSSYFSDAVIARMQKEIGVIPGEVHIYDPTNPPHQAEAIHAPPCCKSAEKTNGAHHSLGCTERRAIHAGAGELVAYSAMLENGRAVGIDDPSTPPQPIGLPSSYAPRLVPEPPPALPPGPDLEEISDLLCARTDWPNGGGK